MISWFIRSRKSPIWQTTRTLRYYDELGMLEPAETGENGYRTYDHDSLLRLQQILFFRELDIPLKDIRHIMAQSNFDLVLWKNIARR